MKTVVVHRRAGIQQDPKDMIVIGGCDRPELGSVYSLGSKVTVIEFERNHTRHGRRSAKSIPTFAEKRA
jgi:hypothetical protein